MHHHRRVTKIHLFTALGPTAYLYTSKQLDADAEYLFLPRLSRAEERTNHSLVSWQWVVREIKSEFNPTQPGLLRRVNSIAEANQGEYFNDKKKNIYSRFPCSSVSSKKSKMLWPWLWLTNFVSHIGFWGPIIFPFFYIRFPASDSSQ